MIRLFLCCGLIAVSSAAQEGQPARGVGLDVKAAGPKTFYVDDRAGSNQVSIFSQATLEDFTTVCNKVSGECRVDPKDVGTFSGRFSIRAQDLKTGIELRDEHLRGPDWLDAARHPEIVVEVKSAESARKTEPNTAGLTLVGTCTVRGKSNPVRIPATLTYLDETPVTMKRVKGDLIRVRAEFDINLSDYGIAGPAGADTMGLKVSDKQNVKVSVFGSTEQPPPPLKSDKADEGKPAIKPRPPEKKP